MSHTWISHVTYMNKSCHAHMNESCHTWMSHITRTNGSCCTCMNESCHTHTRACVSRVCVWHDSFIYVQFNDHILKKWEQRYMSHFTRKDESCYAHKNVMSHTQRSHGTNMNESCHAHTHTHMTLEMRSSSSSCGSESTHMSHVTHRGVISHKQRSFVTNTK